MTRELIHEDIREHSIEEAACDAINECRNAMDYARSLRGGTDCCDDSLTTRESLEDWAMANGYSRLGASVYGSDILSALRECSPMPAWFKD